VEGNVMWSCKYSIGRIVLEEYIRLKERYVDRMHSPLFSLPPRHPKISYSEFKEVQQEHLQHLDNIGSEFIKGFREVLWVKQGRHRQRRQLYRDCTLFLMGVTILDVVILSL
jgi:hypothetical protein